MRRDPVKMIKKTSIWHSKLYTSMHTQAGMTRFCQHAAHFYECQHAAWNQRSQRQQGPNEAWPERRPPP